MHSLTRLISADLIVLFIREISEIRHRKRQAFLDGCDFFFSQDLAVPPNRALKDRQGDILAKMMFCLRKMLRGLGFIEVHYRVGVLDAKESADNLELRFRRPYQVLVSHLLDRGAAQP